MDESVTLVVKAPNQQVDDQTICCEVNWTVKRLKGHLSEVYPSKPRLEDQKLIYSGQLLTDNVTLKDVLRSYEGQNNHTVHLVCSPSKESLKFTPSSSSRPTVMPATHVAPQDAELPNISSSSQSSDGLRHRATSPPSGPPLQPQWPFTFSPPAAGYMPPTWPTGTAATGGSLDNAVVAQQMAWMQQAYAQYMAQYMQLMASGGMPTVMQMPGVNQAPAATRPPPLRQDNLPVNQPAPNGDEEDIRGNRDWLDWFYLMTRMLVLFSIVYFYSSPVRFFVVSTLGIIMYLYQVGFFRAVQRLDQQEEEAAPPTPPPTPDNNNTPPTPDTPQPPPAPPSPLALTWAAFSSFFLSLIPEQPNIL